MQILFDRALGGNSGQVERRNLQGAVEYRGGLTKEFRINLSEKDPRTALAHLECKALHTRSSQGTGLWQRNAVAVASRTRLSFRDLATRDRFVDDYRKAGLPE